MAAYGVVPVGEMPTHNHVAALPSGSILLSNDNSISHTWIKNPSNNSQNTTGNTGNSQSHNNMMPYQAVQYWQRMS